MARRPTGPGRAPGPGSQQQPGSRERRWRSATRSDPRPVPAARRRCRAPRTAVVATGVGPGRRQPGDRRCQPGRSAADMAGRARVRSLDRGGGVGAEQVGRVRGRDRLFSTRRSGAVRRPWTRHPPRHRIGGRCGVAARSGRHQRQVGEFARAPGRQRAMRAAAGPRCSRRRAQHASGRAAPPGSRGSNRSGCASAASVAPSASMRSHSASSPNTAATRAWAHHLGAARRSRWRGSARRSRPCGSRCGWPARWR